MIIARGMFYVAPLNDSEKISSYIKKNSLHCVRIKLYINYSDVGAPVKVNTFSMKLLKPNNSRLMSSVKCLK